MPKLDKNEVLVKIAYVSQNPTGTSSLLAFPSDDG